MYKKLSLWLAVVGVCLAALSAVGFAAQLPNLQLTIPRVDSAPAIDGKLDDAAWLTASIKGGKQVVDVNNLGTAITEYPRVAYLGYDDAALYVAFVIFTPDVTKLQTAALDWWNNDEAEIFLDPGQTGMKIQIGIDAGGYLSDSRVQVAQSKDGIRWVIEAAIPWSVIGGKVPAKGDKWGINLTGHQVAAGDTWVAFNTTYGGFHNVARFATAVFSE